MYARLQEDLPDDCGMRRARWPRRKFEDIRPALASHFANLSAQRASMENESESSLPVLATVQTDDSQTGQSQRHRPIDRDSRGSDETVHTLLDTSTPTDPHCLTKVDSPTSSSVKRKGEIPRSRKKLGRIDKKRRGATSATTRSNGIRSGFTAPLSASEQLAKLFKVVADRNQDDSHSVAKSPSPDHSAASNSKESRESADDWCDRT